MYDFVPLARITRMTLEGPRKKHCLVCPRLTPRFRRTPRSPCGAWSSPQSCCWHRNVLQGHALQTERALGGIPELVVLTRYCLHWNISLGEVVGADVAED